MYELYLYRIYSYLLCIEDNARESYYDGFASLEELEAAEEAATLVWDKCNKAAAFGA